MGAGTPGLEINAGWHQSRAGPGDGRARRRPSCGWPLHPALLGVSQAASTQRCRAVGAGRDKGDDWLRIPSPAPLEPSGPQESTQPLPRFQKTLASQAKLSARRSTSFPTQAPPHFPNPTTSVCLVFWETADFRPRSGGRSKDG